MNRVNQQAMSRRKQRGRWGGLGWMNALAGVALAASFFGCAHGGSRTTSTANLAAGASVSTVDMEPLQIEVSKDGGELQAFDAPTLFDEAGVHMDQDRFAEAIENYQRLVKNFPDSPYVPPALYNAGLSLEALGKYPEAAEHYALLSGQFPAARLAKEATLRLGACYAELSRWPASIEALEPMLRRTDLTLAERIEAQARVGLGYFEIKDFAVAERTFREVVAYYQAHKEEERIESPFFVAMAQFYDAHLAHRRFRDLPMRLPQKQLEQDIAQLAKQFLSTQDGYVASIRHKDPFWATAAGFHVGALYRELYDRLLSAPLPAELDSELKKLVYGEMLKSNLRTLLEKAQAILQKNVDMAGRVGVKNGWVERSSEQVEEIGRLLATLDDQQVGPKGEPAVGKPDGAPVPPRPATHPRTDGRRRMM